MWEEKHRANRRRFLKQAVSAATAMNVLPRLAPARPSGSASTASPGAKPNIIFIMVDDLGYGDLGCYGGTKIKTPNIDALAAGGIRFTDAHSPDSVCTPTRYGVLTGRYSWRGRLQKKVLWSGYEPLLVEPGRKTIGHMMKELGYHTAHIGKWHLGWGDGKPADFSAKVLSRGPKHLGFDYSFVTAAAKNMYPTVFVENQKVVSKLVLDPKPETDFDKKNVRGPRWIAEDWDIRRVDEIYTEKTLDFIRKHHATRPKQPFYIHLPYEAPHKPNDVPDRFRGKSGLSERSDQVLALDWMVGKLLGVLDELGLTQNTLVIFTSDNGAEPDGTARKKGHETNGEFRGQKRTLYEGGHRVPFIARWPKRIAAGTRGDVLICLTDMMATFAAITGYSLSHAMGEDSYNVLPALLGEKKVIRTSILHHDIRGAMGIRVGKWKYMAKSGRVNYGEGKGGALYDMEKDWRETTNLYDSHPNVVEELKAILEKQRRDGRTAPARK